MWFSILKREKMRGSCLGTLPIQHAWSSRFLYASVHMQRAVYRRKWLEGHVAPPPKSQLRGHGIHTAISLHDLRDASLENTSGPSFELRISNYASRCNLAYTVFYTQSKKPSFEWSFKLRNFNDNTNCALCSRVKTVYVTLVKYHVSIERECFHVVGNVTSLQVNSY